MMHKLMRHILSIQIGHKKIFFTPIIFISFLLTGCWSKEYDYWYEMRLFNETTDTLIYVEGDLNIDPFGMVVPPNSYPQNFGGSKLNVGDDVIFDGLVADQDFLAGKLRVYRGDSLLITWKGPAQDLPDSIHSPFNYNSWDYWLVDDNDGIIQFVITEEDLRMFKD